MRTPRFSIRRMMLGIVGVAFALMALRFSTLVMACVVLLLTIFGLGLAILAAVYRRGSRRAFWLGFALMGCGYLVLSSSSWAIAVNEFERFGYVTTPQPSPPQPVFEHWIGTTMLLDVVRPAVQASKGGSGVPSKTVGSLFGWMDPRTSAIKAALDRPLRMPFAIETPLEEALIYIRSATVSNDLPEGIQIYVDPAGLIEAEKSLASPISLAVEGVPLRTSLKLLLKQLDLGYTADDGLLTISSLQTVVSHVEPVESFRRVGHSFIAVLFGLMGGFAARALHASREPLSILSRP